MAKVKKQEKPTTSGKTNEPRRKQEREPRYKLLLSVSTEVRNKAQKEATLAHLYQWIPRPTISALFTWLVNDYLDKGIKAFIEKRQKEQDAVQTKPKNEQPT